MNRADGRLLRHTDPMYRIAAHIMTKRSDAMNSITLDIPLEQTTAAAQQTDAPDWLKPYLAAALRSGLLEHLPAQETAAYDAPITGAEAAVMLQNALDLQAAPTDGELDDTVPVWAVDALDALSSNGICLTAAQTLTRGEVANILYLADRLAESAPGTAVFRIQQ